MNIADLFVNLGIKGSEKTVGALEGVKTGLKDTASMSIEAKAALLGVMYALERTFTASGQRGTDLVNFNALLGVSSQQLERYRWAAQQVGVSNESVEGTFKSLQRQAEETVRFGKAPAGLNEVGRRLGHSFGREDMQNFTKDPAAFLQVLQRYAQTEQEAALRNLTLESFHLDSGMIASLVRNAYTPEVMDKAPVKSDADNKKLDRVRAEWANLGTEIQNAIDRINIRHGDNLIKDITKIVHEIENLINAFDRLAKQAHIFEAIDKAFSGWVEIFKGLTDSVKFIQDLTAGLTSNDTKTSDAAIGKLGAGLQLAPAVGKEALTATMNGVGAMMQGMGEIFVEAMFGDEAKKVMAEANAKEAADRKAGKLRLRTYKAFPESLEEPFTPSTPAPSPPKGGADAESAAKGGKGAPAAPSPLSRPLGLVAPILPRPEDAAPRMAPMVASTSSSSQTATFNQNFNFTDGGKDSRQIASDVRGVIQSTFRQYSSQEA